MNPEIKNRFTGKVIIEAGKYTSLKEAVESNKADLRGADLRGAYLTGAYLAGAYLRGADLRDAYLRGAYLRDADLTDADLTGADLTGAYLRGAKYKEPLFLPDLYSIKLFPPKTKLRYWKYLKNGSSPYQCFKYEAKKEYTFDDYDPDENTLCGKGGNVATLQWCLKDCSDANEFMEVEFNAEDIAAIPFGTDGKFRVKRFKTLRIIDRKNAVSLLKKAMGIKEG